MALSIGVDVGGTKIAAGVVDEEGAVLERIQRASPANDRASILDTIVDCALELKESRPEAVAVGIGAAGFVSSDRNTMASGTNLDWTGMRIGDVVSEGVGLPVVVENDANAAGWAEARFGAGAGKRNVLVVTLGTGVGGAVVIEIIFNIQGMGQLIFKGIKDSDVNIVQGVSITVALAFIIINIVVDMLYVLVNPRIRSV